ncbi:hypothetical protein RUM43_013199 [Polyplax serrata]|uniref:Cyclic nucleotide-binding domain-containing protein n=1 Tax=Polyplax serrata TaxID=468196 RepID=A0AAN8NK23_POLSC
MVNTRKLRDGKKRRMELLIVDYISLIPVQLFYNLFFYVNGRNDLTKYILSLRVNDCLRMYQVPYFFIQARYWVYKMRVYLTLLVIEIIVSFVLFNHLCCCIYFNQLGTGVQENCMKEAKNCILQLELMVFSFLSQSFVEITVVEESPIVLTVVMYIIGYVLTYGIIFPLLYFATYNHIFTFVRITTESEQLHLLLNNIITNKALKDKIVNYFQTVWNYGKGKRRPEIVKLIPISLQKSVFLDIHWDAIIHSDFFSDVSWGCKRSLAQEMRAEFILPNTVIFDLTKKKTKFIYLESGLIQIMAQENNTSPVITFSSGTVLCEISLFYQLKSKAVLSTANFCIIHFIDYKHFIKVLLNFPMDMRKIFKRMKYRITAARFTYARKKKIFPHFVEDVSSISSKKGNIKWIKQQYRGMTEVQKAIDKEGKLFVGQSAHRLMLSSLHTQIEHTSLYLSLIAINDKVISQYDAVCLRWSLPWFLDPQCNFLKQWNRLILFLIIVTIVCYPAAMGWTAHLPEWFFSLTCVISLIYFVDFLLPFVTAVKEKNVVITKFEVVMMNKLSCFCIYMDLIAALPFQLLRYWSSTFEQPYMLSVCLFNVFFKCYKIHSLLNEWNYKATNKPMKRTILKHFLFFATAVYVLSMIYKLSGIECIFYECSSNDWFARFEKYMDPDGKYRELASFYLVVFLGLDLPNNFFSTNIFISYILYVLSYFSFRMYYFLWMADIIASYAVERFHLLYYTKLMNIVEYFMRTRRISRRIRNRICDTMKFQWFYDRGNYLTRENRIIDDIPDQLKRDMDKESLYRTLQLCPLFKMEDESFILDMCKNSQRIALPANSVLITFGIQTLDIYVIHRGFVQSNSFLVRDAKNNVGFPFVMTSGDIFPVMVAFNQIASVITSRTLSDCELIVFKMEDVIKLLFVHEMLKDVVESLKETDWKAFNMAKPGISIVGDLPKVVLRINSRLENALNLLVQVLYAKAINSNSKVYIAWEIFRSICILVGLIFWPYAYAQTNVKMMRILLVFDSTAFIDIYLRTRLSYYDDKGVKITHPFMMAVHYMCNSFVTDLISVVPCIHVIHRLLGGGFVNDTTTFAVHMAMRFVALYKLHGLINYFTETKPFIFWVFTVKYLTMVFLACNFYVNIVIFEEITENPYKRLEPMFELYYNRWIITCRNIMKMSLPLHLESVYSIIIIVIFGLSGWAIEILNHVCMLINFFGSDSQLSDYQYYLKSFMKFLNGERIEDIYVKEAVNYYEHVWSETKGIDFNYVFSRFPNILHEDLLYSAYISTLNMVSCFKSNETFYRTLSGHLEEIYMVKGSTILFEDHIKSDIFLIHKGQCEVKNTTTLYRGSMFGDIRRQRLMKHTITAKTHVVLLKVSSDVLFLTMDNFYSTTKIYETEIFKYDDFVQSSYVDTVEVDVDEILPVNKSSVEFESKFEAINQSQIMDDTVKEKMRKTKDEEFSKDGTDIKAIFHPTSLTSTILNLIFLFDAFLSVFLIPLFISVKCIALETLLITYALDLIWIAKIIVTLKTAVINPNTGILSYNKKYIYNNYLFRIDGFITDVLSVVPFEVIPFLINVFFGTDFCFVLCYLPRTIRLLHISQYMDEEKKRLSSNLYLKWFIIIVINVLGFVNIFVCLNLWFENINDYRLKKCYWALNKIQWVSIRESYMCVINCFCSSGMTWYCDSDDYYQILLETLIAFWGCFTKATIFVQTITIFTRLCYSKFKLISQLEELENYLSVRSLSPTMLTRVKVYLINLFEYCKEGGMPQFLKTAPDFIKFHIMGDLYLHHLSKCFLFKGVPENFLTQLCSRLERVIYFPGNYIVKQGDVDHNIYFIHKGEVYCLERDEEYFLLERLTYLYHKNDYFGVLQGIFPTYAHPMSFRAKTLVEILVLNFNAWEDLRMVYHDTTQLIYRNAKEGKNVKEKKE